MALEQGGILALTVGDAAVVSHNRASISGGVMYVAEGCSADVTISGTALIHSNSAGTDGGVLKAQRPKSLSLNLGPGTMLQNNSALYGGCVMLAGVQADAVQISGKLIDNVGISGGGVLALSSSSNVSQLLFGSGSSCVIEGSQAGEGGAVYVSEASAISTLVVDPGCRIASNSAQRSGGFMSVNGGSFVGRAMLHGQYSENVAGLQGGLLSLESAGSTIKDLTLAPGSRSRGHSVGSTGGLIHVGAGTSIGLLYFHGHQAGMNKAGGDGGLVQVATDAEIKSILINGSSITSSQANTGGCISIAAGARIATITITVRLSIVAKGIAPVSTKKFTYEPFSPDAGHNTHGQHSTCREWWLHGHLCRCGILVLIRCQNRQKHSTFGQRRLCAQQPASGHTGS